MTHRRSGFTVIELLVVVGIVCVLAAVLLPVLQNARESARRATCAKNLQQFSLGLLQYHETHHCLPPGQINRFTKVEGKPAAGGFPPLRYVDPEEARRAGARQGQQGTSWILQVLPQCGQESVFQAWKFDTNVAGNGADAGGPARKEISSLYCPSRRAGMKASAFPGAQRLDAGWSTGGSDYAACAGSGIAFTGDDNPDRQTYWLTPDQLSSTIPPNTTLASPYTQHLSHVGAFGVNTQTTLADITDGRANVILLAERRMFTGDATNARRSSDGWAWGGPATLFTTRLAPQPPGAQFGKCFDEAGSEHAGGLAQVAFADGRVKAISVNVDLRVWNNLGNMKQGAFVPAGN